MSWTQTVTSPSLVDLLVQITGQDIRVLLEIALNAQGIKIEKVEEFALDSDAYGVTVAQRIFLSDGGVFEPKLVRQETADGNWGNDIYEYRLKDEQVEVEQVDVSDLSDNGEDDCNCSGCGCDDDEVGC
jgi:hypothetical protein